MMVTIRRAFPMLAVLALLLSASLLQAQSVADAAKRSQPTRKASAKVYTNDNLPTTGTISVIGTATPPAPHTGETASAGGKDSPDAAQPATSQAETDAKGTAKSEADAASTTALEPAQRNAELQKAGAKMKEEISMLERELDLLNREFRLRAATYYADAGNSLRNPKQWAEQQREHESKAKEKQAALDTAKQKFSELQEQARRVGVNIE